MFTGGIMELSEIAFCCKTCVGFLQLFVKLFSSFRLDGKLHFVVGMQSHKKLNRTESNQIESNLI